MHVGNVQSLNRPARAAADLPELPPGDLTTLVAVTRWRAERQPDALAVTFLVDGEEEEAHLTYAELDRRARSIAAGLQARGAAGERVLLVFSPGLDYIAAVFGCLYAGAVAVPVYPPDPYRARRTLPRLLSIVEDAQAGFVLSNEEYLPWVRGPLMAGCATEVLALESLPTAATGAWCPERVEPHRLAILQYTSGSTAAPKGVMLTHANLMHNCAALHRLDRDGVVAVSWLPPYHDMGLIGCVLLPVHSGRRMVLLSPLAFVQRPARWLEAITRYRAMTSGAPNFGYDLCVRKVTPEERGRLDLRTWSVAVNGSEPVRAATIDAFCEAFGPCGFRREAFYPAYGLAESTLLVSGGHRDAAPLEQTFSLAALGKDRAVEVAARSGEGKRMISCGQPIPGGEVTIVDPCSRRRLAVGRVGEIWVRSPSVGLGYWNRPEESENVFRGTLADDPAAGPYLRTGDLGFLHGGELFVAGRLKELLILAGRNYYPQDLERCVAESHPALKEDGGAAFTVEVDGEERLVVVHEVTRPRRHNLDEVLMAVRTSLAEEFELAAWAVVLISPGALPKTSSGKTQRRACGEAFLRGKLVPLAQWCGEDAETTGASRTAEPPQSATEQILARIWSEVLGVSEVGRHDDFFALGGHSLRAVQLVNRLAADLDVELPLAELFRHPTPAALAERVDVLRSRLDAAEAVEPVRRLPPGEPAELSFAEQRLWFWDRLQPGHPFYNLPVAVRLRGPLDAAALGRSLEGLVARHAALRTRYPETGGRPIRQVDPPGTVPLRVVDLSAIPSPERRSALDRRLREEARAAFDLAAGPLFRAVLFRLDKADHVLLLAMHHVVADGWSLGILARELAALYRAAVAGEAAELPPPEVEYADFAAWQRRRLPAVVERDLAYWQGQLGEEPSALALPFDRPRPPQPDYDGALLPWSLSPTLTSAAKRLAAEERTTLFVVLTAAFQLVLARICRQSDVALGTIVANRQRRELEGVVGFFANTLTLRTELTDAASFRELIGRVGTTALEAFEHQELPFDQLVERLHPQRAGDRAPLFQVALVLENMPLEFDALGDLRAEPLPVDNGTAKYDLALLLRESKGRIAGSVEYATALFDAATVERLAESLTAVLEAAARDPDQPPGALPLLGDEERQRVLASAGRRQPIPAAGGLHTEFEKQARRAPERAAIRHAGRTLTYGELDAQAERLASRLAAAGVSRQEPVAVLLPRSPELVVAMLGVLKAGAIYAPADPQLPPERLEALIEEIEPSLVLTNGTLASRFPAPRRVLVVENEAEGDRPRTAKAARGRRRPVTPDDLAYLLFTSGSTGRPKGVLIEHGGVVNFVRGFSNALHINADCRVLNFFSPSSDGSISDVFSALANGACLVIAGPEILTAEGGLQGLIRREGVTTATLTPSMLALLEPDAIPELTTVCAVGEPLTAEVAAAWCRGRRLLNGYGVSEASCGACLKELREPVEGRVPMGRPLANVGIYILDQHLQPVPPGIPGEICIGGVQVGRGYLNRPEETARSFVADPFADAPGSRLYRTGDWGRLREDGDFECLGRMDDQINLRGHRIEPGEIAAALEADPLIDQAAVIVREDAPGGPRLVAYLVPAAGDPPSAASQAAAALGERIPAVRRRLRAQLPAHMIPAAFVVLEALPRSIQGKLDRAALPPPATEEMRPARVAPRNTDEALVAAVWEELLGTGPVGVTDDFFDLGGHSMLAVQVMAAIEARCGRRLPLAALFQEPTVEHLARLLSAPEDALAASSLVPLQPHGANRPFFCFHPAGGTVFCYRDLARHLGADRPFYGIQAMGVDGTRPPLERVEEMVAHYIEAIRSIQARGPYLLGGWSLGGNLAFEAARVLAEAGEEIALLAILDAAPLHPDREPTEVDFLPMVMELFPDEENLPLEAIRGMAPRAQLEYFTRRAGQARIVGGNGEWVAARHVFEVFKTGMRAMIDYRQRPFPGRVTLFAAEDRAPFLAAEGGVSLGWQRWAEGGVEHYTIPGRHVEMVREPSVAVLAARLRECLARTEVQEVGNPARPT